VEVERVENFTHFYFFFAPPIDFDEDPGLPPGAPAPPATTLFFSAFPNSTFLTLRPCEEWNYPKQCRAREAITYMTHQSIRL